MLGDRPSASFSREHRSRDSPKPVIFKEGRVISVAPMFLFLSQISCRRYESFAAPLSSGSIRAYSHVPFLSGLASFQRRTTWPMDNWEGYWGLDVKCNPHTTVHQRVCQWQSFTLSSIQARRRARCSGASRRWRAPSTMTSQRPTSSPASSSTRTATSSQPATRAAGSSSSRGIHR